MNKQRETIYRKRRQLLAGIDTKEAVVSAIDHEIDFTVTNFILAAKTAGAELAPAGPAKPSAASAARTSNTGRRRRVTG